MEWVNKLEPWFFASVPWAFRLAVLCLIGFIIYRLWQFIDDTPKEERLEVSDMFILCFFVVLLILITVAIAGIIASVYLSILAKIPLIYYLSIGGFLLTIYTLRYLRRTHKAVHGHITNPNAHKEDETQTEYMKKLTQENKYFTSPPKAK